jgi:hypothetical protein
MAYAKYPNGIYPKTPPASVIVGVNVSNVSVDSSAVVRGYRSSALRQRIIRAFQLLTLMIVLYPTVTTALPIGWTTGTVNGANVVIDNVGNQWLSPTNTVSQSFSDSLASEWVTTFGFQAVSLSQFHGLLAAYGLPPSTDLTGDGYISNCCDGELLFSLGNETKTFFADFGANVHDPAAFYGPEDHSYGFLASSETYPTVLVGQVRFLNRNGDEAGGAGSFTLTDAASAYYGTWFIAPSSAVPGPASLSLLSLGLLVIAIRRRRSP